MLFKLIHMAQSELLRYIQAKLAVVGRSAQSGTVFAKVLTPNDDTGRHGVLIPSEAYDLFPVLEIPDPAQNATCLFESTDLISGDARPLAYKYYQRYPERRITKLNPIFNLREQGLRVVIVAGLRHADQSVSYYVDGFTEVDTSAFREKTRIFFGDKKDSLKPGDFVVRELASDAFTSDDALNDLLVRFDKVAAMQWVDSMRTGSSGIGYTFETLIGIEENNDTTADFRGIEIKCKHARVGTRSPSKINLFQQAPSWCRALSAIDRIRAFGSLAENGLHQCYSQVSTTANNLDLQLMVRHIDQQVALLKMSVDEGFWAFETLKKRLLEKHSRAVFVKARTSVSKSGLERFWYEELVYCETPSIAKFIHLVERRDIVFEFTMSEKEGGKVRNHGYPWRLARENLLSDLFAVQTRLR